MRRVRRESSPDLIGPIAHAYLKNRFRSVRKNPPRGHANEKQKETGVLSSNTADPHLLTLLMKKAQKTARTIAN